MNIALLTAGGTGNRMGQDIPKQFMTIDNVPVIIYTLKAFQEHPEISYPRTSQRAGNTAMP